VIKKRNVEIEREKYHINLQHVIWQSILHRLLIRFRWNAQKETLAWIFTSTSKYTRKGQATTIDITEITSCFRKNAVFVIRKDQIHLINPWILLFLLYTTLQDFQFSFCNLSVPNFNTRFTILIMQHSKVIAVQLICTCIVQFNILFVCWHKLMVRITEVGKRTQEYKVPEWVAHHRVGIYWNVGIDRRLNSS